jgi:hypothetical protein
MYFYSSNDSTFLDIFLKLIFDQFFDPPLGHFNFFFYFISKLSQQVLISYISDLSTKVSIITGFLVFLTALQKSSSFCMGKQKLQKISDKS